MSYLILTSFGGTILWTSNTSQQPKIQIKPKSSFWHLLVYSFLLTHFPKHLIPQPLTSQLLETKYMVFLCFLSLICPSSSLHGLPWWLSGKKIHLSIEETQESQVQSLAQEDSLEEEMAAHSNILCILSILQYSSILSMGNPMDRRAWQATVPGVTKSRTHAHICILTYSHFLILPLSLISILSLNVFFLSNVILLFI